LLPPLLPPATGLKGEATRDAALELALPLPALLARCGRIVEEAAEAAAALGAGALPDTSFSVLDVSFSILDAPAPGAPALPPPLATGALAAGEMCPLGALGSGWVASSGPLYTADIANAANDAAARIGRSLLGAGLSATGPKVGTNTAVGPSGTQPAGITPTLDGREELSSAVVLDPAEPTGCAPAPERPAADRPSAPVAVPLAGARVASSGSEKGRPLLVFRKDSDDAPGGGKSALPPSTRPRGWDILDSEPRGVQLPHLHAKAPSPAV